VQWDAASHTGAFEYDPGFLASHIEIAPVHMPLGSGVFRFPHLARSAFDGLPGLLADELPDRFGRALVDAWLESQGRRPGDFNPVERLCHMGTRAMGALEFGPALLPQASEASPLEVESLRALAEQVLQDRSAFATSLAAGQATQGAADILRVGTSAGGARAKAIIAWNRETGEVRSGQLPRTQGFSDWILKFDGVQGNRDRELADPEGFGQIEYAYALMAGAAGIEMAACRLFEEAGRKHFMTQRFDRDEAGRKLHMQSLAALSHLDFNLAGAHSYEQVFSLMDRLRSSQSEREQQYRRMLFNVLARNQDDHVKNIAFLMDRDGIWRLSPAFDVTYAFNPAGDWTSQHQMSLAGKRDQFLVDDFWNVAQTVGLERSRAKTLFAEVRAAVRAWPAFAEQAQIEESTMSRIQRGHRAMPG